MLLKILFILSLLLIFKNSLQSHPRYYNFIIDNVTCTPLSTSIKYFNCNIAKLAPNHYLYSGEFMFNKLIENRFNLRYFVNVKPLLGNDFVRFIDLKFKACDLLKIRFDMPMVQQLIVELLRTSNLPKKCPLQTNFRYSFTNLSYSDRYFNKIMPHLNFVSGVELLESNEVLAILRSVGSIEPKARTKKE